MNFTRRTKTNLRINLLKCQVEIFSCLNPHKAFNILINLHYSFTGQLLILIRKLRTKILSKVKAISMMMKIKHRRKEEEARQTLGMDSRSQ